jgi:hypothetical protein
MNEDFNKPFIKSLIIVAMVTVFSMILSHYAIDYYSKNYIYPPKNIKFSTNDPIITDTEHSEQ